MDPGRRITELAEELAAKVSIIVEQSAHIVAQDVRIAELAKQLAELKTELGQNSSNSHKPPSSDPPKARHGRRNKNRPKSKRRRGGQPGHRGAHRELVPQAQVDKFVELFPPQCESCWKALPEVADPLAKRYQLTELPPIKPHITEYRRHSVRCRCGYKTQAAYDETRIPASPLGPRLMALIAVLTGVYHISRRRTVDLIRDVVGTRISLGAVSDVEARVSEAMTPAVAEAWASVEKADVKHTDGTGWLQSHATRSLWTIATAAATVYRIVEDGCRKTLEPLFGKLHGILVSDRARVLAFWAIEQRQICWAHLLRRCVSFSERDGPAAAIGRELLDCIGIMFEYWHDYKAGKLTRDALRLAMAPLQLQFEAVLTRAVEAKLADVSGSCADMLWHKPALWNFVQHEGVEPTNNHAERELRAFVLWRRRSFGTQSDRGNLFAERVMTVAHTARKQNVDVLPFVTACCLALRNGTPAPSLFATA